MKELNISLQDTQWDFTYTDHDRDIVRAIVIDHEENYYFVRVERDDDFGKATLIETAGGGVESGENLEEAIVRELKEELGVEVEIITKLGVVKDFYNLIHRRNINNYYLCKINSFGEKEMTDSEINDFHLSTLKLTYEEARREYVKCSNTRLGKLIADREIPVLEHATKILENEIY